MTELNTGSSSSPRPRLRVWLLITMAFFSGAAVMLIELSANRVLAPWFGNTLFTWTGLIGVILCAMSGGYYFGGWLADRRPSFTVLGHLLLGSAAVTFLIPILAPVLAGLFSMESNIIAGPVAASFLLFALPGFLLGAVSPFAIRLASLASADRHVGVSAGTIGMSSTLGSVIGTFAAGFLLIPQIGIRAIFLLVGVLLVILAATAYILFRRTPGRPALHLGTAAITGLVLVPVALLSTPPAEAGVVFDKTTYYHRIRITEEDIPGRGILHTLLLDTTEEGAQFVDSGDSDIAFQSYWELSRLFCPDLERAAFLGAGAFMMPEKVCDTFPTAEVDVVEIDPEVIEAGRRFFRVGEYPRMHTVANDARLFLAGSPGQYDLIFGDAYNGLRNIPAHLVTAEFFSQVKDSLKPDGVYMMNIISAFQGERSGLFQSLMQTLALEFDHLYVFAVDKNAAGKAQNLLLVASDRELPLTLADAGEVPNGEWLSFLLSTHVKPERYSHDGARILTDDFNPVEYIIAKGLLSN